MNGVLLGKLVFEVCESFGINRDNLFKTKVFDFTDKSLLDLIEISIKVGFKAGKNECSKEVESFVKVIREDKVRDFIAEVINNED